MTTKRTFTTKETSALRSIIDICIDQYETSGGDIDYAGFGDDSLSILNGISKKLNNTELIHAEYSVSGDMTFILKETRDENGDPVSTEVVGFYYGEPNEESTAQYIGKLKAEY